MTRQEVINLIGDVIYDVNSLMTEQDRGPDWNRLEDVSESLYFYQRKLIKNSFELNTDKLRGLAKELGEVNKEIQGTIDKVGKFSEALDTMAKFVGVVENLLQALGVALAGLVLGK